MFSSCCEKSMLHNENDLDEQLTSSHIFDATIIATNVSLMKFFLERCTPLLY